MDIKFILKNRALVEENARQRQVKVNLDVLEELAKKRVDIIKMIEETRVRMKKIAKETRTADGDQREKLVEKGRLLREDLRVKNQEIKDVELALKEELFKIPNFSHPESPIGTGEEDNVEVAKIGEIKDYSFVPKNHLELGSILDIIDFEAGTKVTGKKFYFLKNQGVFLELALMQYALKVLQKHNFQAYLTPDLAKLTVLEGTGYIPRGPESQIYKIEGSNLGLIATAEITLGGIFKDTVIDESDLPIKMSGLSHCFRTEAGSYGKASRGLYRVHQFSKIEMFVFCLPEDSDKTLEDLVNIEKEIYEGLEIPFRVMSSCTTELGGSAYRKYDLEAWLPGENRWGEITSASNCTDYQSRRLNVKFKKKGGKKAEFAHTLNGTAIAVSRTLVAILENFQKADGTVIIPKALHRFLPKECTIIKPKQ